MGKQRHRPKAPRTVTLTADVAARWPDVVERVEQQSGLSRQPTTAEVMRALVGAYLRGGA